MLDVVHILQYEDRHQRLLTGKEIGQRPQKTRPRHACSQAPSSQLPPAAQGEPVRRLSTRASGQHDGLGVRERMCLQLGRPCTWPMPRATAMGPHSPPTATSRPAGAPSHHSILRVKQPPAKPYLISPSHTLAHAHSNETGVTALSWELIIRHIGTSHLDFGGTGQAHRVKRQQMMPPAACSGAHRFCREKKGMRRARWRCSSMTTPSRRLPTTERGTNMYSDSPRRAGRGVHVRRHLFRQPGNKPRAQAYHSHACNFSGADLDACSTRISVPPPTW